ncbi:MAG: hypothetical protein KC425_07815, partial [Anaerolineales bacterium]|nr:hypothetical protein [Anaerolineales bacterium]
MTGNAIEVVHGRFMAAAWPLVLAAGLGLALARLPLAVGAGVVGGTAVFLLALIQPLAGLGAALLLGPLGAWEALLLGPTPLDSGQLALLLTLAAWGARQLRDRQVVVPRLPLFLPLLGFCGVAAVSLFAAPSFEHGVRELIKWVEIGLVMWLVVDEGRRLARQTGRPAAVALLVGFLLLAGVGQGALGFWQFALRGDGPAHFLVPGGFYRAYGTFMQPNPFGGFVGMSGLLGLGTALGLGFPTRRSPILLWASTGTKNPAYS